MKERILTAALLVLGILLASHTRDVAVIEGLSQAILPGLALVGDMTLAAMLMTRGW